MVGFPRLAEVVIDERGSAALIRIDEGLYSEDVVLRAAYWLTDRCYVHLYRETGLLVAEVRTKDGAGGDPLSAICGEFCNALVDFAVRAKVAAETIDIQEALLRRAFFELVPKVAG